jgi:hypothetical protein
MSVKDPLTSLKQTLAFDPRDWSINKRDAWLWGIINGWDTDIEHFTKEENLRLKALNKSFDEMHKHLVNSN